MGEVVHVSWTQTIVACILIKNSVQFAALKTSIYDISSQLFAVSFTIN